MSNYVVGVVDMSRVFKSAVSPCTVRGGYAAVDTPSSEKKNRKQTLMLVNRKQRSEVGKNRKRTFRPRKNVWRS